MIQEVDNSIFENKPKPTPTFPRRNGFKVAVAFSEQVPASMDKEFADSICDITLETEQSTRISDCRGTVNFKLQPKSWELYYFILRLMQKNRIARGDNDHNPITATFTITQGDTPNGALKETVIITVKNAEIKELSAVQLSHASFDKIDFDAKFEFSDYELKLV